MADSKKDRTGDSHSESGADHACCTPSHNEGTGGHTIEPESHSGGVTAGDDPHAETLVRLGGRRFLMGADDEVGFPDDGEGPAREVYITPFLIDRFAVSNERFAAFVDATGYRTEAERYGWSFVFHLFVPKAAHKRGHVKPVPGLDWWLAVKGACWRHPEGKGSGIHGRLDHPVTHVSWNDAIAYCEWAGCRLPTEAEWELAARGGLEGKRYAWGDELTPGGRHMCNIWQGDFPKQNSAEDGWQATCPVDEFAPNGYGLYNVAGNVWEWCADWWTSRPVELPSTDPTGPAGGTARVMRGGSYLCHHSYCNRYRVAARSSNTPDSSTGNLGFRVARDPG